MDYEVPQWMLTLEKLIEESKKERIKSNKTNKKIIISIDEKDVGLLWTEMLEVIFIEER